MSNDLPDRTLGFLLHDAARLMRKRFEQKARHLGLTRSQWQVLANLVRHDGIQQGTLAELLEIEPITLVRLVDRLEAAGFVERRPHATDRRVRLLFLTKKVHPMLREMRTLAAATREEALDGIPAAARDRLIDMLVTMRGNLTQVSDSIAAPTAPGGPQDAPVPKVRHG